MHEALATARGRIAEWFDGMLAGITSQSLSFSMHGLCSKFITAIHTPGWDRFTTLNFLLGLIKPELLLKSFQGHTSEQSQ